MGSIKFYKGTGTQFNAIQDTDKDPDILYFIDHNSSGLGSSSDSDDFNPDSIWVGKSMVGSRYVEDLSTRAGSTVSLNNLLLSGNLTVNGSLLGDLNMGNHKITNLSAPTGGTDAANKDYIDGLATTNVYYGTCDTAAATAAKVVDLSGSAHIPTLTSGQPPIGTIVFVKFTNTNSKESPTLKLKLSQSQSSTAAGIRLLRNGSLTEPNTTALGGYLKSSTVYMFVWTGTYWAVDVNYDTNNTYNTYSLGFGFAPTCVLGTNTNANDALDATINGSSSVSFTRNTGGRVVVKIPKLNGATPIYLSVKGQSSSSTASYAHIYYNGAALTTTTSQKYIKEDDWCVFYNNGYETGGNGWHLIARASDIDTVTSLQSTISDLDQTYLPLAGGNMAGEIDMRSHLVRGLTSPVIGTDAANKDYVDKKVDVSDTDNYIDHLDGTLAKQFAALVVAFNAIGAVNKYTIVGVNEDYTTVDLGFGNNSMEPNTTIRVYVYAVRPTIVIWDKEVGEGEPTIIQQHEHLGFYATNCGELELNGVNYARFRVLADFTGNGDGDGNSGGESDARNCTFINGEATHLMPGYNEENNAQEFIGTDKWFGLSFDNITGKMGMGILDITYSAVNINPGGAEPVYDFRTVVVPVSGLSAVSNVSHAQNT